ncbi:hypothetical protein [Streptomyces erythrochromogenes]|nr:hypothetical protein OG364_02775 [Streptomyces erythrochromogenes]
MFLTPNAQERLPEESLRQAKEGGGPTTVREFPLRELIDFPPAAVVAAY